MMDNEIVTGCINPETLDRINPGDAGGQYDSSGGQGGQGNPAGSVCTGYVDISRKGDLSYLFYPRYNHYVELLEPAGPRACIRCCYDPADCRTDLGKVLAHCLLFYYLTLLRYKWMSYSYPWKLF